jgi:dihydroorotate dehydrogenase (NAD+) catalytic subunit
MINDTFYDPKLSYEDNYERGPFGEFANKKIFKQEGIPNNSFLGIPVYEPFGIPAGPLINSKFVNAALDKGFDLVEYKTVRSRKYKSHSWPNVLSVKIKGNLTEKKAEKGLLGYFKFNNPPSITNSFGVPSLDPEDWQKDMAKSVKYSKKGQLVIGSFQGTLDNDHKKYVKDFVLTARLVKETGVKCMEVNLSCPNEGHSNMLCFDIDRSKEIAFAIKNEIGNIPLIVKISYFHNKQRLGKFVYELGDIIQGISAINTLAAKVIDERGMQALPGEGRIKSGVCGDAIRWAGLHMVKRLNTLRTEFDYSFAIIGVGGVLTPEHYLKYRSAGADAVMSATGAMWNPFLAQQIKELV